MEGTLYSPHANVQSPTAANSQWPMPQTAFMPSPTMPTMPTMNPNQPWFSGMASVNPMNNPMNMFGFMQQMASQPKVPIGTIDDDMILIREFKEANGRNPKQILESLDMKNGFTAQQWKDYYLDHTQRLDRLIYPHIAAAKKAQAFAAQPQQSQPRQPSKQVTGEDSISRVVSKPLVHAPKPQHASSNGLKLRIKAGGVPQAPSRSPTPPSLIIAGPRGNKFTDQDKDYFLRFILWQLKCDPSLSRQELCNNLEDRCPHHTAQSWNSYWRHHGALADKAMERGRGEASPETLTSSSSDDEDYAKKKPSYSTSARTTSNSIRAIAASTYSAPPRIRNQRENLRIDQDQMGPGGGSITVEDKREVARYIASHNEIEWSNKRQKFIPFHEKWPQRSAAAWAETYRRFSEEIDTNVAIYRSQAGGNLSSLWSSKREGPVPRIKREEV